MQIDRYEIDRVLGEGAMGKVYLAQDPKLGRQVAVKVLGNDADPETRRRFRLEARAIAALEHPNIVEMYDFSGEEAQELFLVMEFVPGRSLYDLTRAHGCMSEVTAMCVGHELAMALEYAHERQVVHRDLKPENVLLHRGRVVLMDFGAVKAIAAGNVLGEKKPTLRTRVLGTPGFMAPEQFAGEKIGAATDLFALGATLYNLTTGQIPYSGGSVDEVYHNLKAGRYARPTEQSPLLSADFCQLLAWCLAPKIKDRCPSATALRERLLRGITEQGISEVRSELERYEARPATAAVEQRERSVDSLLKELKVALKDKQHPRAKELMLRIQTLAPLDGRMEDVSGVSFDARMMQSAVGVERFRSARRRALVVGLLLGLVLGAAGGWLAAGGALPF